MSTCICFTTRWTRNTYGHMQLRGSCRCLSFPIILWFTYENRYVDNILFCCKYIYCIWPHTPFSLSGGSHALVHKTAQSPERIRTVDIDFHKRKYFGEQMFSRNTILKKKLVVKNSKGPSNEQIFKKNDDIFTNVHRLIKHQLKLIVLIQFWTILFGFGPHFLR